ncbi:hypothetical protein [Sphingobium chungbukense]|uniref:hypothetical protein n=1 Tax=Sphingobium chungbukense TaxID=56193 RepID=UPI00069C5166|nr:hypothetical protein [Sphingobium chungbukense]
MAKLQRGIECVAVRDGTFKDMSALYPALRMVHCEHHYISARRAQMPHLLLWRFLASMDLMVRLMNRLKN